MSERPALTLGLKRQDFLEYYYLIRIMIGIFCRPSLLSLVCSFEFHVTGSGVEAVHDTPFLGFKLLLQNRSSLSS